MQTKMHIRKLGDICYVVGGGTPSKTNASFFAGTIPWATVRDMKSETISETEFKISEEGLKGSSSNIIPKNNVVIATRVGLGKVCLLENDTAINQDLRGVIPKSDKELSVRYLFWWFKSILDVIIKAGSGATVQGVKLPFIKSLEIPLPPLAEQKRIVKKLDSVFEKIQMAKENAEKNLKNSRELFESYLQAIFADQYASSECVSLADLAGSITDGDHMPPPKSKAGVAFITISNIDKDSRKIDFSDTFTVSRAYFEALKVSRRPQKGDVLYTVTGSPSKGPTFLGISRWGNGVGHLNTAGGFLLD